MINLSKKTTYLLSIMACFILGLQPLQAQKNDIIEESKRDIYTVGGAGIGGAVLGLSTLSFVDEPEDHLKNILVGGAIGIIIGVGIVAFRQASKNSRYYSSQEFELPSLEKNSSQFTTAMRSQWHRKNHFENRAKLGRNNAPANSAVNVQFSF